VRAELKGIPEKALLKSRNLVQVDLVWPRTGIARRSAAREAVFKRGVCDFTAEPWTKRAVFREDVEGHCGFAVAVTEPVSVQKIRRFLRLTAKYALKMGADFMEKAMVGYADIASSPIDALAAMIGEKDVPEVIAQGVLDINELPAAGAELEVTVPLVRPLTGKAIGSITLVLR
jgi:predicted nucleotidyltransferase